MKKMLIRTIGIAAVALIGCASVSAMTITYYSQYTGTPGIGQGGNLGVGWPFGGTVLGPTTISAIHFGSATLNQPGAGSGPYATGADIWEPFGGANNNSFAADIVGSITAAVTGNYLLSLSSDDGSELWINGVRVIDNGGQHAPLTATDLFSMTAGTSYNIELRYFESLGNAAYLDLTVAPGVTFGTPDGGSTVMLLGAALSMVALLRKKLIA